MSDKPEDEKQIDSTPNGNKDDNKPVVQNVDDNDNPSENDS